MVRRIAFWALLPFIVPQGLWLRSNAPRFPPAAGPQQGIAGIDQDGRRRKALRLLAIGDSIIAGVGAPRVELALPGEAARALAELLGVQVEWQALGRIGLDAKEVLRHLVPQISPAEFNAVVVSVGVNDVTSLKRSRRWREDLAALLDALRRHSPHAVIALVGVPPLGRFPLLRQPLKTAFGLRAKIFDHIAREVAGRRDRVLHLPLEIEPDPEKFSADGYHPSTASYRALGEAVAALLASGLQTPNRSKPE